MKKYINIDNVIYVVKELKGANKLKETHAYIHGSYVYPFKGKIKSKPKSGIGVYKVKGTEEILIVRPVGRIARKYSVDNIYSLDAEYISKLIKSEGVKDGKDEALLKAEVGEVFAPVIENDDNELQRVIKKCLQHKKIDLKNYEHRFKSPTDLNNFKRALIVHGTMSMDKFNRWCDILDLEYELTVKDKEDCPNPMNTKCTISNKED